MVELLHQRHIGSRGCVLRRAAVMVYDCFQAYEPGIIIIINWEAPLSTFCETGAIKFIIIIIIIIIMI